MCVCEGWGYSGQFSSMSTICFYRPFKLLYFSFQHNLSYYSTAATFLDDPTQRNCLRVPKNGPPTFPKRHRHSNFVETPPTLTSRKCRRKWRSRKRKWRHRQLPLPVFSGNGRIREPILNTRTPKRSAVQAGTNKTNIWITHIHIINIWITAI